MTNNVNQKYDGAIREYLLVELKMPAQYIENTLDTLRKYPDIYSEFGTWLGSRVFPESGVKVEGYNAKILNDIQPRLSGLAIYLLLVNLRGDTERTLGYIKEGLPIR